MIISWVVKSGRSLSISMIALNLLSPLAVQTGRCEGVSYVLLERKANGYNRLILDILVEPKDVHKDSLEGIFRALSKDSATFQVISVNVWDDREAYNATKSWFGSSFLTPDQHRMALLHFRAFYDKRNRPPYSESYSFNPTPGSKSETVDLLHRVTAAAPADQKAESDEFQVAAIEYQQVPSVLTIVVSPGFNSTPDLTRVVCGMVANYPSFSRLDFYDDRKAAARAPGFSHLPQTHRTLEEENYLKSHRIATYARNARGRGRGALMLPGEGTVNEVNEQACGVTSPKQ